MPTKVWYEVPIDQEIEGVPESGYAPIFFPPEGAKAVFEFTESEFLKVLSALINGALVTYGDEWLQVVWYFLRNVEYPVSLCDEIAAAIATCESVQEAIADLVGTPGPVQEAIRDLVTTDPDINNHFTTIVQGLTTEQIGGSVLGGDCNNSVVAGRVIAIVDAFDGYNLDALQILEVGTNDEERMASLIAGIPVFGALPVDEIFDVLQDILEDFGENYAAAITPEWKDDVAEDLYCLAKESPTCELTYEQLFNYFQNRAVSGLTILSTVFDLANFIKGGDFDNDDLVASGMYAFLLAALLTGRDFFGMNLPKIGAITRDASPSSAWEDWDECAPELPIQVFEVAGYSGGTYAVLSETTARFTAGLGADTVYRVAFQFNNDAPRCVRMAPVVFSGSIESGYNGVYACGSNPATNGYTDGLTLTMPPSGQCWAGLVYGSFVPFQIDVTFTEDC